MDTIVTRISEALQVSEAWLMGIDSASEEIPDVTDDRFPFRVKGDSMEPKISDGDLLSVHRQDTAKDGDIVLVQLPDSKRVCKRFRRYAEGIMLVSTNQKYDPLLFTDQELTDQAVKILGKVVELRARVLANNGLGENVRYRLKGYKTCSDFGVYFSVFNLWMIVSASGGQGSGGGARKKYGDVVQDD